MFSPCPGIDVRRGVAVEARPVAGAPHEVGVERPPATLEDEVDEVGPHVAHGIVGHQAAALPLEARRAVVVGVGRGEEDLRPFLVFVVAFDHVTLGLEASQGIELHAPRVGESALRRTARCYRVRIQLQSIYCQTTLCRALRSHPS